MKHTELNNGNISNLLDRYLNVKVIQPRTLFEVKGVFDSIADDKCPWCSHKIYTVLKTGVRYCKNKKCPTDKPFRMSATKYLALKECLINRLKIN